MIHETAIIYPNVIIGDNVYIGAYCVIGAPAENKKTWGKEGKGVIIGDNVVITGLVTIDEGVDSPTTIGNGSFIMKGSHVGHDALLVYGVILSPHVNVGGYVTIGSNTNIGMGASIHQFSKIPCDCMIGMNTVITKATKLEPYGVYVGCPARYLRRNEK